MRNMARLGAVAAATVGMALVSTAPAGAAPKVTKSDTSAGYIGLAPSRVTSFSGTLDVPTLTCPASGTIPVNGEIGLFDIHTSDSVGFDWYADCVNGTAEYLNSYVTVGSPVTGYSTGSTPIAAGDSLSFSLNQNSKKSTLTAKITDTTKELSASVTADNFKPSMTDLSAETNFGSGTGPVSPIPSFTTITFGSLLFNGKTLSSDSPTKYEMYDGSTLQVATSSISSTGTFTNTFVAS